MGFSGLEWPDHGAAWAKCLEGGGPREELALSSEGRDLLLALSVYSLSCIILSSDTESRLEAIMGVKVQPGARRSRAGKMLQSTKPVRHLQCSSSHHEFLSAFVNRSLITRLFLWQLVRQHFPAVDLLQSLLPLLAHFFRLVQSSCMSHKQEPTHYQRPPRRFLRKMATRHAARAPFHGCSRSLIGAPCWS